MPVTGSEAERMWRRVYTQCADLFAEHYTKQQVVDLFYEYGVIESPTVPADMPTIRDYVIDTLQGRFTNKGFLRDGLPRELFLLQMDGVDVSSIAIPLGSLGYRPEKQPDEAGLISLLPPKRLPKTPMPPYRPPKAAARVVIPGLSNELQELVDELNDNIDRDNKNAAALLTRKIISQAVFVAMAKRGRESELRRENGDDLDLSAALRKCKEACGVSAQVMGRVTSAKWIGDAANHSYRVKVTEEELERTVTGMSLFLKETL